MHAPTRRKLIVFWEGTANTLNPLTTQIGLFSEACRARAVEGPHDVDDYDTGPLKISFDGCGVTHGNWGVLLARGLDEQVQTVVNTVRELIRWTTVHVVAVGLSRGGIACMKLARALSQFSNAQVTVSTLLFDPVPGNAVSTGFPWTATSAFDLSQCQNLIRVLALYPYEPLPDIAMHAPTLGRYNRETTLVQEDVTMGCHQGALLLPTVAPRGQFPELSLRRILDYLAFEGVELSTFSPRMLGTPGRALAPSSHRTFLPKNPRRTSPQNIAACHSQTLSQSSSRTISPSHRIGNEESYPRCRLWQSRGSELWKVSIGFRRGVCILSESICTAKMKPKEQYIAAVVAYM
jgi:hypothetical protein